MKIRAPYLTETLNKLKESMHKYAPQYPFEYHFFDELFQQVYAAEQKIAHLFSIFSLIAILLSCFGLFGLGSFMAAQRTKEIGIRKVLGASIPGLFILLTHDFIKWVFIANLIAWPVAYYAMQRWLQNFAYRIELTSSVFLIAGLLALVIALFTVGWQVLRVTLANPVEALKYE